MDISPKSRFVPKVARLAGTTMAVLTAMQVFAQYPGSPGKKSAIATERKLRSTAVLEWIGEPGKPSASRIVPIAVWDGTRYQDGGLYLAQPEPLAVEDGTEYELQHAGVAQGTFVIFHPGQVERNWFGYGVWHPVAPLKVSKLKPSKTPPRVVTEVDPDRPSLNKSKDDKGKGKDKAPVTDKGTGTSAEGKTTPAPDSSADNSSDPDRPTLHKRGTREAPDTPQVGSAESGGDSKSDSKESGDVDPDRPKLNKRRGLAAEAAPVGTDRDPDRPDLHRGRPATGDPALLASKLTGMPAGLQQLAAISDSSRASDHSFVYHWANPDDAEKMKAALEDFARKAIAGPVASNKPGTVTNGPARFAIPSKTARPGTAAARAAAARKAKTADAPMILNDEAFSAFELSYSGGATLVLTARSGDGDARKSVTIIAQPDFYGVPHLLLQSVTRETDLDATPEMRLVDAADTDGDNRAELIFELRGESDRQFAIYKIAGGRAEQVFTTGSLPLGTKRD